ncbi:bifunctional phosphopantothenoylcysteine decarboxylase/phosphopantothenate--cysteine ligase CoaBC [Rhodoplanes sp. Z2-YC6860]|uniref:bifunctional phosphopantothenoylcysteine decarboxylase/phosphopantothenate--cysteine ligase CoaBC n=1 Tax=Rhodoplanes sp. Z2-YC6860 TaxID=674703 RepID=UPI00078C514D|nr:bifunctional phosphopantothenoylcysteine decarboxylase/phosphopantothenate--cysteine ligase CoaBC [Rhodoplanes sp. Z2-YC6860]AMN38808.1 phosphopantothenoylcysteine decarboxylase/phosphopantothenate-cysteine ligase [Rhodoplanes sp. Z2-YC6860]
MASLTVRQLDERLKKLLRLRAAKNGRSVEDEVRTILRGAAEETGLAALDMINPPNARQAKAGAREDDPSVGARRVLLIIGGGIAAYKSLDLIRRLRERGLSVRVVMTEAAQKFITPLSAGAISGEHPYTDLFDTKLELDVGHIRLARDTSAVIVAPATADLMAKMANGHADDLASAVLLATDKPVLLAPAMNPKMWSNKATARNLLQLKADGVSFIGPNAGEMAESGEAGTGRMAEPLQIVAAAEALLAPSAPALKGLRMIVTSGPTHEPIDPVRYIANRSSGKQGHAIAEAAARAGAHVTLVSGPVNIPDPPGVNIVRVESARDMLAAVEKALPADIAVFAAAVADWRTAHNSREKIKKTGKGTPELELIENPDILSTVAHRKTKRPALVIGFAAETQHVIEHAKAKLARKGCDWILANDVSPETGIMGGDSNTIHLVTKTGVEDWPPQSKTEVAAALIERIAAAMSEKP